MIPTSEVRIMRSRRSERRAEHSLGMWDDADVILRLENISKRYPRKGQDRVALDSVSLELRRGQMVGVYGPAGSGKTTLLRVAGGFETPSEGIVTYKGERLDQMSAAQLRRHHRREIGCVWAGKPWISGLSVLEDVALPLELDGCDHRAAQRTAHKFLAACGAKDCLGVDPEDLSDGERQRVAIARALVIEPRLLLADGAVSTLAVDEQEAIMALFGALAHDAKVAVLITNPTARAMVGADPIVHISDGRLAGADAATEQAQVYQLSAATSRRSAADA
jgi:putative ABC transport system ATP-binding protein